ncbi:MAG: hypothetical protein QG637_824 [Chloroflexota bacterium]|nr:hypothetical protein [Chloroflexota bacterium]
MSRYTSFLSSLILVVVLFGLTGCSAVGPRDRPAGPATRSVGRLTAGDAAVDLALINEPGGRWVLQATYTFPAGRYTGALLIVARSDQPIVQRQAQEKITVLPVVLRQDLPDLKPGQWVNVSAAAQAATGEMTQLGVARLEAVAGPEGWRVIELTSAAASAGGATPLAPTATAKPGTAAATPTGAATQSATATVTAPVSTTIPATATAIPPTAAPTATAAVAATVSLSEPAAGATLTTAANVRGTAAAFENQLTVQVLDARGNVLGQQGALVQAAVGQAGPFAVSVPIPQVTVSQDGTVRAFVTNPKDGSVAAEASVKVRLVGAQTVPTRPPTATATPVPAAGALVQITEPATNASLKDAVVVKGRARAFENQLTVQVRDAGGAVLGQAQAVFRAEPGQIGDWEVRVDFDDPATARPGQIYAFIASPKDGGIAADATVAVRLAGRR